MSGNKILYDQISHTYNVTRQADPYIAEKIYEFLSPQPAGLYLDIGCGTGNYTVALADKGLNFYGVEPSEKMLKIAAERNSRVRFFLGRAEQIPFTDELFDGAIATLTIHHWTNLRKAFAEIYRVLKHGARLVFFTATPTQMRGYWLNHYFPQMLADSIIQMPDFNTVNAAAIAAGFTVTGTENYFIKDDLKDLFLYSGKNRPEIYMDAGVRRGISSFSALSNAEEVKPGLEKLQNDLHQQHFDEIKAKFKNDFGDYLFICLQKC
jgi:ubiquinone/menaquinone biosynthesis C-methylase UbiE